MDHPNLKAIAEQAMRERGFLVKSPPEAIEQLKTETEPPLDSLKVVDRTSWLWSSIDNDESRDLDQIEYATKESGGTRIYVGVADVDWFVRASSPLDGAAGHNTTSVYTGVETFPMLPERLSTDLSSLNEGVKRLAIVVEMLVTADGRVTESSIYSAMVQNKAQLTYNAVGAWLEEEPGAKTPQKILGNADLQNQLKMEDAAAAVLRERRHEAGALTFHTEDLQPVLTSEGVVVDLQARRHNRAGRLIE